MSDERIEVKVLGRVLGTASGWDGDLEAFWFYDFKPSAGVNLPSGDLAFEITEGMIGTHDEAGKMQGQDLVTFMYGVSRT